MAERGGFIGVSKCTDPSGKYFASLLFCGENQTAEKRPAEKFIGIDFAIQGMCVFSTVWFSQQNKRLAKYFPDDSLLTVTDFSFHFSDIGR